MRATLVRVGIDQAFGRWNAPVDPSTNEFVYVPIPDDVPMRAGLETPYDRLADAIRTFAVQHSDADRHLALPNQLLGRNMHLDPDFDRLTYGDVGERRGKAIASFKPDDLIIFYAGLRPIRPCEHNLLYAIIGLYRVDEVVRVSEIEPARWGENAHTRRLQARETDVVVRATPGISGRLRRCIPIGEWRNGAYRVRRDLLDRWGGLSCKDGFIQRSAVPPMIRDPEAFLRWFEEQEPELVASNVVL